MRSPTKRAPRKLIAFVIYPGVTPLDLIGPLTVLRDLRIGTPYRSIVVGQRDQALPTDAPIGITPEATFDEVPAPFALFVPGGGSSAVAATRSDRLIDYIRGAGRSAEIIGSTGNGALLLGAARLLGGRRVATHWAYADAVAAMGADVVSDRWVDDGSLLTAAGGTAGIDAMLHLTARLRSEGAARLAQLWMEYDPEPPFGRRESSDSANAIALAATLRGRPPVGTAHSTQEP